MSPGRHSGGETPPGPAGEDALRYVARASGPRVLAASRR